MPVCSVAQFYTDEIIELTGLAPRLQSALPLRKVSALPRSASLARSLDCDLSQQH